VNDVAHRIVAALERKGIRAVNPAFGARAGLGGQLSFSETADD
jgi:hypothetical protein